MDWSKYLYFQSSLHILHIKNHAGPSVWVAIHVLHSGHFSLRYRTLTEFQTHRSRVTLLMKQMLYHQATTAGCWTGLNNILYHTAHVFKKIWKWLRLSFSNDMVDGCLVHYKNIWFMTVGGIPSFWMGDITILNFNQILYLQFYHSGRSEFVVYKMKEFW